MFGALARRGASVLLAVAVLGGGVALGAGTASAESPAGWTLDPAELAASSVLVGLVGVGSLDYDGSVMTCGGWDCVLPTNMDVLNAWLRGEADPGSTAGLLSESSE